MSVSLSPIGGVAAQFFDNNGNVLAGGKLYSYEAGTTTPKTTYTSYSGTIANSNPIILTSAGRIPYEVWLTTGDAYKFVLTDSVGNQIGTWDNIYGYSSGSIDATTEVQYATAGQTLFVLTTMAYNPGANTLGVYVDGVNQVVDNAYIETNATSVTFVSGLHEGATVKFINLNIGSTDASVVTYEPGGAGAVATTVQAKLRESVSILDFGAIGDGVTDDRAAIQNALNASAGKILFFPEGTYYISDPGVTLNYNNMTLIGTQNTYLKCERIYFVDHGDGTYSVGQGNVINANGVNNITIKDISIIGSYNAAWGNAYVYAHTLPAMTDGKKLLYFDACDNITLDNFTITNAYGSNVPFVTPEDRVDSVYGFAPVGISGGDDIRLINCNHVVSSSEAWSIFDCTNVIVNSCIFDTNYGVSYLDITYCTDVVVTANQFMKRLISDAGELLNAASSQMTIEGNKFLNGNCDIGNEYLNANLTIGATFLLHDQIASNNTLYNGAITCSTLNGTYSNTWCQENVIISNNTITIDVDTRPSASGSTVLDYVGISLPKYKNARNFLVTGNSILLKGAMQTSGANPKIYNTICLINSYHLTTGLLRENFSITNNRLMTDITSYDPDDINDDSGAIRFRYGEYTNLVVDNNYIDAPVAVYIQAPGAMDNVSISGNHFNGEAAITIPYEGTTTDFSNLSIEDNTFVFWNTAGHTYTSADCYNKGFGYFLMAVIGQTATMPNTSIKNNNATAVGFAYVTNSQTSANIDLALTLDGNNVNFVDYAAVSAFSIEQVSLARANTANTASTVRLTNNYFLDETASGVTVKINEVDILDLINNVWTGVYTLSAASDNLAAVTNARFVRKNNMAFGTLTPTYLNLSSAPTQIDEGNSGGF